jgi:hypothetical protein
MFGKTGDVEKHFAAIGAFPFLAIETDGTPFPMLVEANLEAFIVQARRLHHKMTQARSTHQTFLAPELKPPI